MTIPIKEEQGAKIGEDQVVLIQDDQRSQALDDLLSYSSAPTSDPKAEIKPEPIWGYYPIKGGGFESRLFQDGKLPKGWKDSPAGMGIDEG